MEDRRLLESWKEIAAYLNRSVMTCHRWEAEMGLPVHRLDGTPKARVFAYADEVDRWKAEKLRQQGAPSDPRRKNPRWIWMTAGAMIVTTALAVLGWRLFLQHPLPVSVQAPSLTVLPFENKTGDWKWDVWRTAIPDLLTLDLLQSRFMDVMRTPNLLFVAGPPAEADKFSPEDLRKLAATAGVDFTLTGAIDKSQEVIVITAHVHDRATGEVIASLRSACRTEKDAFSVVDELSKGIKATLNLSPREIRRDIDRPAARITTSSPEAFKLFSQAYRIQGKRKYDEAIPPLLKAVELDPEFALAYGDLFRICRSMSRPDETRKYGAMAVRLADRLDERERGRFLTDYFLLQELDKKKAIPAFQRLGKYYPYDLRMLNLSGLYIAQEEWDKAVPILEKLFTKHNMGPNVRLQLAACYQALGFYVQAEKVLDDYLGMNPNPKFQIVIEDLLLGTRLHPRWVEVMDQRWSLALAQKDFDAARNFADGLISVYGKIPWLLRKADVEFMVDDFQKAEKTALELIEKDDENARMAGLGYLAQVSLSRGRIQEAKERILKGIGLARSLKDKGAERDLHFFLAYLERLSGRLPEALKEAEEACWGSEKEGLDSVRALHLKALIALEMDLFEEFDRQIEEIKGLLDPDRFREGSSRFMRIYYHLLGHRELRKNNSEGAIRYFWKAQDSLSVLAAQGVDTDHAKYFYDLGEAYRRSGNLAAALPMYEKVLLPTVSRRFSGDLYALSYFRIGQEYEQRINALGTRVQAQERRLKAIENYRKFLDLWKDADPIFPEIEDAKARLARLEAK